MKQINNEKIKRIVESLMFEPNDQVINNIIKNWNDLSKSIELFNNFNLENLEPMTHIDQSYQIDFLREDIPSQINSITKETILTNTKNKDDDYVILAKVVQ
ncbi:glutamyl-tRNA amidotransferase [Mycoplasmopsis bovirhinis]|uniref:Glutamyl-tRNA(Gln)amidotransferase subunit C n=1 Tax=Mycoplasmopsis bovirhinis TaxID=29553 RepID=A0A2D1JLI6_9BACT|nr:glutamyl-tRNA amidotransferase [Mycoplasmopsis bovirhinis]ATO30788.1 glutamyl-tRNA amidotransferase [Mycoplasmopsis bovirhinis]VEU62801.1 glutamyl-tRNA(gln)amidotransferase subunit C [Mycoplasmopsis bovirhinis]